MLINEQEKMKVKCCQNVIKGYQPKQILTVAQRQSLKWIPHLDMYKLYVFNNTYGVFQVTAGPDTSIPPSLQGSSPHNSSSLRDASEVDVVMPETSFDFTPKHIISTSKQAVAPEGTHQTDSKTVYQVIVSTQ